MLADLAIWPDVDGRLRTLGELCEPRSKRVAGILSDAITRPHEHVRRSPLVATRGGGPMSLRRTPLVEEIGNWLDERLGALPDTERPDRGAIRALRRLQSHLAALLKNAAIAHGFRDVDVSLPALAQDGSLRRRGKLVAPSPPVKRLALRRRFLLTETRHDRSLDTVSAPLREPTADMLLATFEEDPENARALQARLDRFEASRASERQRSRLERMAVLPVDGGFLPPCELALKGRAGDYWGEWKVPVSAKGLSQDDQRRYRMVGVTSSTPTLETTGEFFEWLSGRDSGVVERHVPCVLRHLLLHGADLREWARQRPCTGFVPVDHRAGRRLASWRMVKEGLVFLPDARDLATMVTERDPKMLVAIDRTQEVTRPASEVLRRLGVQSLREALAQPKRVFGRGTESEAPEDVREALDRLRSPSFQKTFLKGLGDLGVDAKLVWRDWPSRLSRIARARLADDVLAEYRLRGESYAVKVEAGLDSESGVCWVKRARQGLGGVYRALAAQLVFKPGARPVDLAGLEIVLHTRVDDPSYGRPGHVSRRAGDVGAGEEAVEDGDRLGYDDDEPGEAVFGHAPFTPDPARNLPTPGPVPESADAEPSGEERRGAAATERLEGGGGAGRAPRLEQVQITDLKDNQYAAHCQMCLCASSPDELAPAGSYIESQEVRRRVIEAHHVDLKSADGARHAGNLILLCRLHHHNYGRRLTRAAVLVALTRGGRSRTIRFGGPGKTKEITGEVIEIEITGGGDRVELFFTEPHATYWRSSGTGSA